MQNFKVTWTKVASYPHTSSIFGQLKLLSTLKGLIRKCKKSYVKNVVPILFTTLNQDMILPVSVKITFNETVHTQSIHIQ